MPTPDKQPESIWKETAEAIGCALWMGALLFGALVLSNYDKISNAFGRLFQ